MGVPERKGLLQTSRRTIAEGRKEVMFVDPGFFYSLFLICVLFSFSLEYTPSTGCSFLLALGRLDECGWATISTLVP